MKTKFSQLVIFRKQAVDKVEQQIASLNVEINKTIQKIASIEQDIITSPMPTSGSFYQISCAKDLVHAHRRDLKNQKIILMQLREDKVNLQKKLKDAYLEFEKAKHLDDVEKAKFVEKQKRAENAYIDEIALMLHNNKIKR